MLPEYQIRLHPQVDATTYPVAALAIAEGLQTGLLRLREPVERRQMRRQDIPSRGKWRRRRPSSQAKLSSSFSAVKM
jgi:hypothetical protein